MQLIVQSPILKWQNKYKQKNAQLWRQIQLT